MQRLPLQRVGVLELVHKQVAHAGVQALLHPAAEHRVGQHHQRHPLHVVHVHPAVLVLDSGKLRNEAARQASHALLVLPRRMLVPRGKQSLQLGFGLLRSHVLFEVLGEPVFLGHKQGLAQHG